MRASLEEAEVWAQAAMRALHESAPTGWSLILFAASDGPVGYGTHVTNMDPQDAVRWLEEWVCRAKAVGFDADDTSEACWTCGRRAKRAEMLEFRGSVRSVTLCRQCSSSVRHGDR